MMMCQNLLSSYYPMLEVCNVRWKTEEKNFSLFMVKGCKDTPNQQNSIRILISIIQSTSIFASSHRHILPQWFHVIQFKFWILKQGKTSVSSATRIRIFRTNQMLPHCPFFGSLVLSTQDHALTNERNAIFFQKLPENLEKSKILKSKINHFKP